jgi:tripartite-type tricarboxylate transporter receptor subunit TctC
MLKTLWTPFIAALFAAVAISGAAQAEFPDKPITLVVPSGAGGGLDLSARVLTSVISNYIGVPMTVKLVPGAAGQIGTAEVSRTKADGYTLLYTADVTDQIPQFVASVPYDSNRDFTALAQLSTARFSFVVLDKSPFKTLKDLMDNARANPGKVKLAHSGQWGPSMLMGGSLFGLNKLKINYIAYKGGGPSMQALLSGDGDFTGQVPSVIAAQGDRVRALATAGDKRVFKNVPTTSELGFPDVYGVVRFIVLGLRNTPADRVQKLRKAFSDVQKDKTYVKLMKRIGSSPDYIGGDAYERDIRPKQKAFFKKLVNELTGGKAR